jgi:GNAT superfamily N-acetyltransferase
MSDVEVRPATASDGEAILAALLHAVNWDPGRPPLRRDAVLADPALAHYVSGWPRPGDLGAVAVTGPDAAPVGAAWLRYLTGEDPGYGYVADDVPELSIGVEPEHRGRGVGRRLVRRLLAQARAAGVVRVCLSVERANPAQRLYVAEGFAVVAHGRDSDTMVAGPALAPVRGRGWR